MSFSDFRIDPASSERMATQGLRMDLVDTSDRAAFESWLQADSRGFLGDRLADTELHELVQLTAYRRTTGVWDDSAAEPETPVATVSSWPLRMTVPEMRRVSAWAISSVTVAPTHHRRGVARAMLEAELRTAAAQNMPIAVLTATAATIYGRYGFGPSTQGTDLKIEIERAGWVGREASGRTHLVSLQHIHEVGRAILERAQLLSPGEVALDDHLWGSLAGVVGDSDKAKGRRAVRYDDADGVSQGFAIYRIDGNRDNFTHSKAIVEYLCSATDDAYAGLWQYVLGLDLIESVSASVRPVDEPLPWLVANPRAVRVTDVGDQLWVRILDLKEALEARHYTASGRIVLQVSDPLGFAAGRVLLTIDKAGQAVVTTLGEDAPDAAEASDIMAELSLGVSELGSLYLGAVSADTMLRAGRLSELRPGSAAAFDTAFRSTATPWLSRWF